jgi:transposase
MSRAYSQDLRQRALDRVEAGQSVRSVALVLRVSASSVVKWTQRFRATGSLAPGLMHGHRPKVLLPHRDWLLARMANGTDFTLRGLQAELLDERGLKVDYRTVWNFVHAEKLSFKKKRIAQRTRPA